MRKIKRISNPPWIIIGVARLAISQVMRVWIKDKNLCCWYAGSDTCIQGNQKGQYGGRQYNDSTDDPYDLSKSFGLLSVFDKQY
jgi:hypothetical protein